MGDNGSVLVQFRASKALVEQADLLAEAQGLSRSAIARRALLRDLRAHEVARSIVMPTGAATREGEFHAMADGAARGVRSA